MRNNHFTGESSWKFSIFSVKMTFLVLKLHAKIRNMKSFFEKSDICRSNKIRKRRK